MLISDCHYQLISKCPQLRLCVCLEVGLCTLSREVLFWFYFFLYSFMWNGNNFPLDPLPCMHMTKPTAAANKMSMQPMAFPYFSTFIVSQFSSSSILFPIIILYSQFYRKKKQTWMNKKVKCRENGSKIDFKTKMCLF